MASDRIFVGYEATFVHDLPETLDKVYEDKMVAIMAPLFHPRFKRSEDDITDNRTGPQCRSDLVLDSRGWTSSVIGKLSPWLDLDSPCSTTRQGADKALKQEVAWATHLSVPAVLLPPPRHHFQCSNYARAVNQCITQAQYLQFWLRIPLTYRPVDKAASSSIPEDEESPGGGFALPIRSAESMEASPWEAWDAMRSMCESNPKLMVALEVTADLPPSEELVRWLGEPVRAVIIPTSVFLTNRKGYPTLSQRHQKFLHALFKYNIQYYLKGRPKHKGKFLPYVQYLHFLYSKREGAESSAKARFEAPYLDYLQSPLQPLMDNLESQTYETFEQDDFKYNQYERAITLALQDSDREETVVMVVGAGRGPLVRAALRASSVADKTIRVFAVEKNPNAVVTLRNLKIAEKWDNVTIVSSDMRHWETSEKADIMVSELLGSFGDNELSPECLDGAQRFLKRDGISIPLNYTSYVVPIMSSRLWNNVKEQDSLKAFETPYVVRLHNFYSLAGVQPCFTFEHPKWEQKIDNRRYRKMEFHASEAGVVYGFAGYFESVLYKDVTLSINPETHSDGMFSWFPIYFPLRTPMRVERDEKMEVSFWRLVTAQKVWYEWTLATDLGKRQAPIHNPNGRSYWIGL